MFVSIIVTYHPDKSHVVKMSQELVASGQKVIVFDNTPSSKTLEGEVKEIMWDIDDSVICLTQGENLGLATAFNLSIKYAQNNFGNVEGILFFDQDSFVKRELVTSLVEEYKKLHKNKLPVGILGAQAVDDKGNPYWVRAAKNEYSEIINGFFQADFVITSFSLVPMTTIKKIGLFDDKLFIDLVDSEYSFRATKHGLLNLISENTQFEHCIGESRRSFLGLRTYAISSPIRNYYQARNLILVGRDYKWYFYIVRKVFRRFVQVVLSAFYEGEFIERIKYFFRGVVHGLRYKGGPYK